MAYKQEIVLTKWVAELKFPDFEFIADRVLTTVNVEAPGKYYIYQRRGLRKINDEVTIDGNSPTIETGGKYLEGTFAPTEYAINTFIKVNENDVLGRPAQKRLEEKIKELTLNRRFNKEYQMKTLLDSASNSESITTPWDSTSATIEKDIRDLIKVFRDQAGVQPNAMIIPSNIWDKMIMDETLSNRWTLMPGRANQENLDLERLLTILFKNFKYIFIPTCMYSSGNRGNETETDLWEGKTLYMLYLGGSPQKMPNGDIAQIGAETTFTWASIFKKKNETVGSWLSPNGKIKYYELTEAYDMKLVCENAVLKVTNVVS
ncbi:MAG TPA: hypothetical protein PLC43_04250 [Caldisericia bacterium]|nr:hypothetical protein [Caldisericia bacterium]